MHVGFPPRSIVRTAGHGPVLVALMGTDEHLTASAIATIMEDRTSLRSVQMALDVLVDEGLVIREEVGRASRYALNREHVGFPVVEALANMRSLAIERLTALVDGWRIGSPNVTLYGSFARADGDRDSDIDLFVVRPSGVDIDDPRWRGQIAELEVRTQRWTGNEPSIVEWAEGDLGPARWARESLLTSVRDEGIVLGGDRLRRPVRRGRTA